MDLTIGDKIKKLRIAHNLTLEQLGDMVGVSKSTVRKWETGMIANMRRDKIANLAKALRTTPEYLMGWEEIDTNVNTLKNLTDLAISEYGQTSWETFKLYLQLDIEDRAEIRGTIKQMLKQDKYSVKEGLKNA